MDVTLIIAGKEIGCALKVDSSLPMNVFTDIETFTKNKYRDTLNNIYSASSNHGTDKTGVKSVLYKNRLYSPILQPRMQFVAVCRLALCSKI